jgi:hypothetical protein
MQLSVPNLERAGITDLSYERFMRRVVVSDDCWGWNGGRHGWGYAVAALRTNSGAIKMFRGHRLCYLLWIGEIPPRMFVCHKCDNPPCCNPAHLFLGTPKANTHDMVRKGRNVIGNAVGHAKLTGEGNSSARLCWPQVREIRARNSATLRELAGKYGVTPTNIQYIRSMKTWKNDPGFNP